MEAVIDDACELTEAEVRERFAWAQAQGNPHWLWPEVSAEAWREAIGQIESVTRAVLTKGSCDRPLTGDAPAIGLAGYTSGMGPLLGLWREQGLVETDTETGALLAVHLHHNRRRMERMAARALEAVEALTGQGIAVSVLKGMHTAFATFPEPGTRPLSDIDLLIDPANEARAGEVMEAAGFHVAATHPCPRQQMWQRPGRTEPRTLGFLHADDPWAVDLQMSLNRRYSIGSATIRIDALRGRYEPAPSWPLSPAASVSPQPLLLIQLACHVGSGLWNATMVRQVELVWVIRQDLAAGRLDWGEFVAGARQIGALGFTYPALFLAEQLAPGTVPRPVLDIGRQETPNAVRRVLSRLTPGHAHRVDRCSIAEQLMWSVSPLRRARHILQEVFLPAATSPSAWLAIHRQRARRLINGTITAQ